MSEKNEELAEWAGRVRELETAAKHPPVLPEVGIEHCMMLSLS